MKKEKLNTKIFGSVLHGVMRRRLEEDCDDNIDIDSCLFVNSAATSGATDNSQDNDNLDFDWGGTGDWDVDFDEDWELW